METRADDLAIIAELRSSRREAVSLSATEQLAQVLHTTSSSAMGQVYVVKLLDVHPRLGKVAGRQLMADMKLSPFTRVSDLTPENVAHILRAVGEHHE